MVSFGTRSPQSGVVKLGTISKMVASGSHEMSQGQNHQCKVFEKVGD